MSMAHVGHRDWRDRRVGNRPLTNLPLTQEGPANTGGQSSLEPGCSLRRPTKTPCSAGEALWGVSQVLLLCSAMTTPPQQHQVSGQAVALTSL